MSMFPYKNATDVTFMYSKLSQVEDPTHRARCGYFLCDAEDSPPTHAFMF
jgi:hypothetical protein